MALHPNFPRAPYSVLVPDQRLFPAAEELQSTAYEWLLPPLVAKIRAEVSAWIAQNITIRLKGIDAVGDQTEVATCKTYLQVRPEEGRRVQRQGRHYRPEVVLAVDRRVRSHKGTQFLQWATARLQKYLHKDFVPDDGNRRVGILVRLCAWRDVGCLRGLSAIMLRDLPFSA